MADTTLYKQIVLEWGQDTDSLIWGMGYSPDNGEHFYVLNTTYGRKYRIEDGDRIWPFLVDKVKAVLDWSAITNKPDVTLKSDLTWSNITNKPDLALKTDLTWSNVTGKPDVALKSDVAAVSAVASSASDKADSNANALAGKVNKADLTWTNITNRPDVDKIASQASQAVVTANTAQSQASAAGQAAASASTQASAAKTTADTATATANAAKASASTASATAASAQQVANSASASASATAVALKNKADTDTVNAQFTAVNSSVASAQSTADNAVAGLAGKLDKTALTWGNIANKPTNLATSENVAKAQSAANSAVSMASGATATANSAKSAATSAVGVANTANTTANSALTKANSATTVANQANSNANQAVTTANSANSKINDIQTQIDQARTDIQSTLTVANNGITAATNLKTTYDNYVQKNDANIKLLGDRITNEVSKITSNGGGRNLLVGSVPTDIKNLSGWSIDSGYVGTHTFLDDGTTKMFVLTNSTTKENFIFSPFLSLENGETYTLSYYAFATTNVNSGEVYVVNQDYSETQTIAGNKKLSESKAIRYVYTFVFDKPSGKYHFRFDNNGSSDGKWSAMYIGKPMLEKGTVAHDWQPAPEDTNSAIEAVSSKIDQTATSITSTVNSTKQDLQGQINSANTKITQTANSITEQLKSYSKTGDMQNYVNTTIQKTADGINAKVSGVESRVDNLNTSDRNLARGTSDSWTDYVFVTDGGNNRTVSLSRVYIDGLKVGDVLTCGITIKNTGITAGTMRVQGAGNATGWNDGSYYSPNYDIASAIPSGTTKELVYTITLTANMIKNSFWDVNIRTDNVPKGGTLSYKCFFVKKGNIPTDWSPAPEDIQSEIDANKTAAANAQSSANSAQSTANTAKSTADSALSKANSNATTLNNKVSKSDLTWANISGKPSISDDDATTTVSSGDLNNYTTTGKYYMPNSLSYYANHPTTGVDMGNWFVMKVDSYIGGAMIIQTIYQINSGDVWIRQRWSNSWKSWRQINFWS